MSLLTPQEFKSGTLLTGLLYMRRAPQRLPVIRNNNGSPQELFAVTGELLLRGTFMSSEEYTGVLSGDQRLKDSIVTAQGRVLNPLGLQCISLNKDTGKYVSSSGLQKPSNMSDTQLRELSGMYLQVDPAYWRHLQWYAQLRIFLRRRWVTLSAIILAVMSLGHLLTGNEDLGFGLLVLDFLLVATATIRSIPHGGGSGNQARAAARAAAPLVKELGLAAGARINGHAIPREAGIGGWLLSRATHPIGWYSRGTSPALGNDAPPALNNRHKQAPATQAPAATPELPVVLHAAHAGLITELTALQAIHLEGKAKYTLSQTLRWAEEAQQDARTRHASGTLQLSEALEHVAAIRSAARNATTAENAAPNPLTRYLEDVSGGSDDELRLPPAAPAPTTKDLT